MSENYCPHCMRPASGARCPSCGGDMSWRGQKGIDLPVGTVLDGGNGLRTYQIGAARGKGGFGITYVARETNSGRRVAVKEYFPTRCAFRAGNEVSVQTMSGQEDVFRAGMNSFLDEGKMLLSQDDLSCVVHVIDYFRANNTAYLVMEYLDGVALHTQMSQMGGRIPVSELMPRLAPLMRDIGQLHRRGVIHRDISPDNIMWMPNGTLKLLDFGSARSMENGKSMTVLMKHGFSPIEQYRSKGQGPYTDIYALAATIYYCVTGAIPPAAVERLEEDGLQSPVTLGAALTVEQETALLWALSIQPNARPQSMEDFAARLYSGGPVYQTGGQYGGQYNSQTGGQYGGQTGGQYHTQTGGQYGGQTGGQYHTQTGGQYGSQTGGQYNTQTGGQYGGQTTGQYNTQTGGQYGSQTGGQYNTQTGGQYGSQTGGQYNTQTGGQYGGQTTGQYNTQTGSQTGGQISGQPGGGGKSKLPILLGGVAAAFVVLIAVVIIALSGRDDPVIDSHPVVPPVPSYTVAPVPSVPITRTGTTSDGYLYEVIDQNNATLTGYQGTLFIEELPNYVEGSIPVTAIAANAFAGTLTSERIYLPSDLRTIGAGAFRGCTSLQYVVATSNVTTELTSFSGCSNLWFVFCTVRNVSGWDLPLGTHVFYAGMETGAGPLAGGDVYDEMLIGWTENGAYVLLDVSSGSSSIYLDDIDWICDGALDNLPDGSTIYLGDNTLYSYETFLDVYYRYCTWSAPDGALSDQWLLSCGTANDTNNNRPSGAAQIVPDEALMRAAIARAGEYAELQEHDTRPDNKGSPYTVLSEWGIGYKWATYVYGGKYEDYSKLWTDTEEYVAGEYASAIAQGDYAGQYYSRLGAAVVMGSDGRYSCWAFLIIP